MWVPRSDLGFQTKAFHEFLTDFHLQLGLQTAEKFFALRGVHRGEFPHHFLPRLIFRVLAPADAGGEQTGDTPHRDIDAGYHRQRIKDES